MVLTEKGGAVDFPCGCIYMEPGIKSSVARFLAEILRQSGLRVLVKTTWDIFPPAFMAGKK